MGVHGLWELLAPVGRRVSVETLAGKKLAIDASIWMIQFMKAMRDERGEMVRNAHLLGFFRRICKLLYLRTKPVFVFDGGTPALKRRTVIARRRQRENAQAKVRKTAEKLLLNHLKAMKLKEIAEDIKNQRQKQKNDVKGKKVLPDQANLAGSVLGQIDASSNTYDQEKLDEMLAASIMAEEWGSLANNSTTSPTIPYEEDSDENEEMILPDMHGAVDPAVLAALTPSFQHDILVQKQRQDSDAKGKKTLLDKMGSNLGRNAIASSCNQEKLDEMLAASLMEEESRSLSNNASTSTAPYAEDGDMDEDEDEDEEMILPAMDDGVDPSILASLPPSMQLDLLVQNRERLMAENRQKYQKVKKDPGKFSELQIQSYLKTVAFRREIDQVQKAASGRGVGGVQTSRIASEAGREFIFSSSFTGDKQVLTSGRAEKSGDKQKATEERHSSGMHAAASTSKSNTAIGSKPNESGRVFDENIETYLDERGRVRVSRVRAMGIHMTRDLQRNLDLMKEVEQEKENANSLIHESNRAEPANFSAKNAAVTSHDGAESVQLNDVNHDSVLKNGASIEISFEDDGDLKCFNGDDDIFACLVAENPLKLSSDKITPEKVSSGSDSDCDWEEGTTETKDKGFSDDVNLKTKHAYAEDNNSNDSEVEWEEVDCDITQHTMPPRAESGTFNSKGDLEERADLQEAIRRSLEDLEDQKSSCALLNDDKFEVPGGNVSETSRSLDPEDTGLNFAGDDGNQQNRSTGDILGGVQMLDGVGVPSISKITDSPGRPLKSSVACNSNDSRVLVDTPHQIDMDSPPDQPMEDASEMANSSKQAPYEESVTPSKAMEVNVAPNFSWIDNKKTAADAEPAKQQNRSTGDILGGVQMLDGVGVPSISKITDSPGRPLKSSVACNSNDSRVLVDTPHQIDMDSPPDQPMKDASEMANSSKQAPYEESVTPSKAMEVNVAPNFSWIDNKKTAADAEPPRPLVEETNPVSPLSEAVTNELIRDIENEEKLAAKKIHEECFQEIEDSLENSAVKDSEDLHIDVTEANLEEEIKILGQERMDLGAEQRRLERNAESVSSEMFTECQELLQMFGLPYIIAPMEAEAQCAYMELANLVDGVVTDDSDVFLFGGRSVYKNIFDDRKYVETYFMKDIENELGLTREKLIRMALLLGSDYTEGVSGIGIVNAIEVVHAFPEEDGLKKFREWIESPDPTILGNFGAQTDSSARKNGLNTGDNENSSRGNLEDGSSSHENNSEVQEQTQSADHIRDITKVFMDKHRKVSKNWHIPLSFPSEAVISAYICPQVDKSTEPFTWGKPDHFVLRKLCWEKFGWGSQKADELVVPVLKEYNKHETQLRLEAFYTFNERFAKIRSKRINKALKGITGNKSLELTDDAATEVSRKNKKKSKPQESEDDQLEKLSQGTEESVIRNRSNYGKKSTPKQSRKRKTPAVEVASESLTSLDDKQGTGRRSRVNGRGRGRGRARTAGRGKGKESTAYSVPEMSSSSDDDVQEVHMEKQEEPPELRRSTRVRKTVDYTGNDSEMDDLDKSVEQGDKKSFDGEPSQPDITWIQDLSKTMASGLSQEKEQSTQKISPGDGLDEDCLEKGGGFCPDDGDNDQPNGSQRNDPYLEGEFSDEYLLGGGFCVDEGENENSISGQATAAIVENDDLSHCSGLERKDAYVSEPTTDQLDATMNDDQTKSDTSPGKTQRTPVGGLCAMPLLRKKRRKS